ncbi:hypothetical protein BGW39_008004 [Mortierella sp. 14UC]|nr:hypothetical protein BGW39_008004 [Mortierella sp. 14UC]
MGTSLALSALIGMAATFISAVSVSSTGSLDKLDPRKDKHEFQLIVHDRYNQTLPPKATSGKKKNKYRETRKSSDKIWTIQHADRLKDGITLRAKGLRFRFTHTNFAESAVDHWTFHFWECIKW